MAFPIRTLGILYRTSIIKTSYSIPLMRLNIIPTSRRLCYHALLHKLQFEPIKIHYKKQREKKRKILQLSLIICGSVILWTTWQFIGPVYDDKGVILKDKYFNLPFYEAIWQRICHEFNAFKAEFFPSPRNDILLPDEQSPRYTIVLELTDVLIHQEWTTYKTGWSLKKRPGVDLFLEELKRYNFEIVIYTAVETQSLYQIIKALDKNKCIKFALNDGATRFINGHRVKDLDVLNRDLSKVVVIDWDPQRVQLHPQNALIIHRWNGNDDHTTLSDLAAFLKVIHTLNVPDVREVMRAYQQFDNPLEAFRENQRKLLDEMEEDKIKKQQINSSKPLASRPNLSFAKLPIV